MPHLNPATIDPGAVASAMVSESPDRLFPAPQSWQLSSEPPVSMAYRGLGVIWSYPAAGTLWRAIASPEGMHGRCHDVEGQEDAYSGTARPRQAPGLLEQASPGNVEIVSSASEVVCAEPEKVADDNKTTTRS